MFKKLFLITLLISSFNILAQKLIFDPKATTKKFPDTLYFPFHDGVQLIVINHYDFWAEKVSWKEATQPMAIPWSQKMGPPPKNTYLFRNKKGELIKQYNNFIKNPNRLRTTNFINTNAFSLNTINDYNTFNHHLLIYGTGNKVGLINLKGEIVVPDIYDGIRKFQDYLVKNNRFVIEKEGAFGFLDSKLKVIFPPIYRTSLEDTSPPYPEHNLLNKKFIKVFNDDKCGLINENGEKLIDFKFDDLVAIHDSLYVGVNKKRSVLNNSYPWNNVTNCIIYDKKFMPISELKDYEQIEYKGINRFFVKKDDKFGVVNTIDKIIVPIIYDSMEPKNGGYYISKDNRSGIMNLDGEIMIPIEYEMNIYFYGDAIYVTQNGLIGVYNNKYKLIAKPQFVSKTWEMGKFILKREDGSNGFVLHQNEGSIYQSPEGELIKL